MDSLKVSSGKYEGFNISELIYLAGNNAPISLENRSGVWEELLKRYFNDGRTFNIYDMMVSLKLDEKYMYFLIAMEYELKNEVVNIPVNHSPSFISMIISLIEFVDKKVMDNPDLKVDWSIHEFYGIKDMLEKVKEAKISDNVLRQKINLFVDDINSARKSVLEEIQNKANEENETNSLVEIKRAEIMQQELIKLNIPLSKINKSNLFDMLKNIDLYYPEDQSRIISRGIKMYKSDFLGSFPKLAFHYFINNPSAAEGINMFTIASSAFRGTNNKLCSYIDADYIVNWAAKLDGADELSNKQMIYSFYKNSFNDIYSKMIEDIFDDVYSSIKMNYGKKLSEVLKSNVISLDDITVYPAITYKDGSFVISTRSQKINCGLFEAMPFLKSLFGKLFSCNNWFSKDDKLSNFSNIKDSEALDFFNFYRDIIIDKEGLNIVKEMFSNKSEYHSNDVYGSIKIELNSKLSFSYMMACKALSDSFTQNELKLIFKDCPDTISYLGYHAFQGWFREKKEFLSKYFDDILSFYDFSNEEDLKAFFKIDINIDDFVKNISIADFSIKQLESLYSKIERALSSEVNILLQYFNFEETKYSIEEVFEDFENIDAYSRLILQQNGVKTSEMITQTGVKISACNTILTISQAQAYYILKYFENKYKSK